MQHAQQPEVLSTLDYPQCAVATKKNAAIHLHVEPPVTIVISGSDASDRQELETFIRASFKRVHDAEITNFMPKLMSVRDMDGKLLAACGLRPADQGALFLETYLDTPIEKLLSQLNNADISREAILEVGNLAVADTVSLRSLLTSFCVYLHSTHSEFVVFTGTSTLRNSLAKLDVPLQLLSEADINRLPEHERATWGGYFNKHPQVMAIRRT